MIIKNQTENIVQGDSFGKVIESKINANKLQKLFGILSGLYKNIFASIVREYASNSWDSHKMSGKEGTPILVTLNLTEGEKTISFTDTGLGMSPSTMEDVYFNYLDSTKEDSDEVIGAFGIGSKSALAYTHTFYIDTIFSGILYHYIFSKQASGIPAGELLFEEPTDKCNGTTVTVPIKPGDEVAFYKALKTQLIYFPNVFVDIINPNWNMQFDNDYQLYDCNTFIYRPKLDFIDKMHLCIGSVYYPINWSELGLDCIYVPIAIKFDIGELIPTPSREDIIYSKESIALIKDRIQKVITQIIDKYNKQVENVNTLEEFVKIDQRDSDYITFNITKDVAIEIDIKQNPIFKVNQVKLKSIAHITDTSTLSRLFKEYKYIDWIITSKTLNPSGYSGTLKPTNYYGYNYTRLGLPENTALRENINNYTKRSFYILTGELQHKKNLYLSESISDKIKFIKKGKPSLKAYRATILSGIEKKDWRTVITEFQRLTDEYINAVHPNYDNIKIPEHWLADYKDKYKTSNKENAAYRKAHSRIIYNILVRGSNKNYVWCKKEDTFANLLSSAYSFIYIESKDKQFASELQELLYYTTGNKNVFKVISMSTTNLKLFKDMPNAFEYSEFLKSNHKILCKVATAWTIKKILGSNRVDNILLTPAMKIISPQYFKQATEINNFLEKYLPDRYYSERFEELFNKITDEVTTSEALIPYLVESAEKLQEVIVKLERINTYFKTWHSGTYKEDASTSTWGKYLRQLMKCEGLKCTPIIKQQLVDNE